MRFGGRRSGLNEGRNFNIFSARGRSGTRGSPTRSFAVVIDDPKPTNTGKFRTPGGSGIFFREWVPDAEEDKGVVFVQHGGFFHGGYFGDIAQKLNTMGMRVLAMDLAGHGDSDNSGGAPRGAVNSFSTFSDDFAHFVKTGRKRGYLQDAEKDQKEPADPAEKSAPVFVIGESMGSVVILEALRSGALPQDEVDGAILCGSAHKIDPGVLPPKPVMFVLETFGRYLPWSFRVPGSDLLEGDQGWDAAFGDKEFAKRSWNEDKKLVLDAPRMRMISSALTHIQRVGRELESLSVPLLVLHGTDDVRCEAAGAEELCERVSSTDKELKLIEGARHQLFQDTPPNIKIAVDYLADWIKARS